MATTSNPQKDTLTSNHVAALETVTKEAKVLYGKAKALDADQAKSLDTDIKAMEARIGNLKRGVARISLQDKAYLEAKTVVLKLREDAKKLVKRLETAPSTILKFDAKVVKGDAELVAEIKKYLPSSGHGNINQALNDVMLGRGKSTTGFSGVLHASAGPMQPGKGCTLFFKRTPKETTVLGVGQHVETPKGQKPKYKIFYGLNKKGSVISL